MCQKDTDIVRWISWPVWSKGPVYQSEKLSFYLTTEINAQVLSFPGTGAQGKDVLQRGHCGLIKSMSSTDKLPEFKRASS